MAPEFDRDQLLAAFDEIGLAAVRAQARRDIAVFGGSALMLASNFRFSTEDVDIAEIGQPWPDRLSDVVARIAVRNGWPEHWRNLADVASFLRVLGLKDVDAAIAGLAEFFPNSRADAEKARYVLKHILSMEGHSDAPRYPRRDI